MADQADQDQLDQDKSDNEEMQEVQQHRLTLLLSSSHNPNIALM